MPNRHRGSAKERRALDAFVKLTRAFDCLGIELQRGLAPSGLTAPQLGVLEVLFHLGPLSQGDICRKLLRSGANVSTVVDNLETAGHVRRVRDKTDRRVVNVSLTPAGEALIARIFPAHAAQITALMGALSPSEQERLASLCRKLGKSLAGARGIP
jgi:MarR family 2-MHQ and catechol resistance regulon transcriptional repressor